MRKRTDAHVHIVPEHLLGRKDPRFNVTVEPYGIKRFADGSAYQFMPDYLANSQFIASTLVKCLDNMNIEKAVIMQSPCLSFNNDVIAAVQTYPDRFRGAMILDLANREYLKEMTAANQQGLTVIKFEMSTGLGYTHPNMYPDMKFDSPLLETVWEQAGELGLTATIDTGPIGSPGYQAEALERMVRRYPTLRFVICHLGFPYPWLRDHANDYLRWQAMTGLAQYPNVWLDAAALPALFEKEGYPYASAMQYLREFIDAHGASKPVWGSDIPGTLNYGTYTQLAAIFENCPIFTNEEKDLLFYGNAQKAYF